VRCPLYPPKADTFSTSVMSFTLVVGYAVRERKSRLRSRRYYHTDSNTQLPPRSHIDFAPYEFWEVDVRFGS
jgi:hypothetical protein